VRRLALSFVAAAVTLTVTACGEHQAPTEPVIVPEVSFSPPPGCNLLQAATLTVQLYARYPVKNTQANILLRTFLDAIGGAPRHDVERKLLAFTKFTLDSYYAGYLSDPNGTRPPTTADAVSTLINMLYTCAALTPPGDLALDKTGGAKVIGSQGGSVKAVDATGVEQAGLLVRAGSVSEDHLFRVKRRADKELPAGDRLQTCVNTTWKIHGQCIEFEVTPSVEHFDVPVQVVICDRAPGVVDESPNDDDDHDEVALVRDPHEELGERGTQVFRRSPTALVLNCSPSPRIGMRNRLEHYLGERPASLLAAAVGRLADAFTPTVAYAFDGLGSDTREKLSLWTVAHVETEFTGSVTDAADESGSPLSGIPVKVTFLKTNRDPEVEAPSVTTETGIFESPALPTGFYSIAIEAPGYEPSLDEEPTHLALSIDAEKAPSKEAAKVALTAKSLTKLARADFSPIFTSEPLVSPAAVTSPGVVTLATWAARNIGSGVPTTMIRNGFYLSTDAELTTSDLYLDNNFNVPANFPRFDWGGPTLSIPSGLASGTYYIGVLMDDQGLVDESDETNNWISAQITVRAPSSIFFGSVRDITGAAIPGAEVGVGLLVDNAVVHTANSLTDGTGGYRVVAPVGLTPDRVNYAVSALGFSSVEATAPITSNNVLESFVLAPPIAGRWGGGSTPPGDAPAVDLTLDLTGNGPTFAGTGTLTINEIATDVIVEGITLIDGHLTMDMRVPDGVAYYVYCTFNPESGQMQVNITGGTLEAYFINLARSDGTP
jgi:hypothetical protein